MSSITAKIFLIFVMLINIVQYDNNSFFNLKYTRHSGTTHPLGNVDQHLDCPGFFVMETNLEKTCSKCNTSKCLEFFGRDISKKDQKSIICKDCVNNRTVDKELRKKSSKEYYLKNKKTLNAKTARYYYRTKDHQLEIQKKRYDENKEMFKERHKAYREKKDKIAAAIYGKKYREKNKEQIKIKGKIWRENNKERRSLIEKNNRDYINNRRKNRISANPLEELSNALRGRIREYIRKKGLIKKTTTRELLGGDFEIVKKHLERQFKKGMSWSNHSVDGWHIDHKIPLSSAKSEEELLKLFHYTNLQPLWAKDNLSKQGKIVPTQIIMTI